MWMDDCLFPQLKVVHRYQFISGRAMVARGGNESRQPALLQPALLQPALLHLASTQPCSTDWRRHAVSLECAYIIHHYMDQTNHHQTPPVIALNLEPYRIFYLINM